MEMEYWVGGWGRGGLSKKMEEKKSRGGKIRRVGGIAGKEHTFQD